MKLLNSTHILFTFAISTLLLKSSIATNSKSELASNSFTSRNASVVPAATVIRIEDKYTCDASHPPKYTDPKGGQVTCGGGTSNYVRVTFLAAAFVGCIVVRVLRVLS